jgi:hypothetical protein
MRASGSLSCWLACSARGPNEGQPRATRSHANGRKGRPDSGRCPRSTQASSFLTPSARCGLYAPSARSPLPPARVGSPRSTGMPVARRREHAVLAAAPAPGSPRPRLAGSTGLAGQMGSRDAAFPPSDPPAAWGRRVSLCGTVATREGGGMAGRRERKARSEQMELERAMPESSEDSDRRPAIPPPTRVGNRVALSSRSLRPSR